MPYLKVDEFSLRFIKITSKILVKLGKFKFRNCLMSSFTNIWGTCTNFLWLWIFLWVKFFCYSCVWDKFDSIHSKDFLGRNYFPWIWKDSVIHLNDFVICLKWKLTFVYDFPLKTTVSFALFSFTSFLLCQSPHYSVGPITDDVSWNL